MPAASGSFGGYLPSPKVEVEDKDELASEGSVFIADEGEGGGGANTK